MTVHQSHLQLAGAPALAFYHDSPEAAGRNGTILFHHGLTAKKESNAKELTDLASRGYLAIGLDAVGHGERRWPDFDERMSTANPAHDDHYYDAVRQTALETPRVIDEILGRWHADPARIGICGISMGGYVAYAALLAEHRLKVATPILGSPEWRPSDADSPHRYADRYFPRAILSQTAGEDRSVPPRAARELHNKLASRYSKAPDRLAYIEFPGAGHFMPPRDWGTLWANVLAWFGKWL